MIGSPGATCNFLRSSGVHRGWCHRDNTGGQSNRDGGRVFVPFEGEDGGGEVGDGIGPALLTRFQLISIPRLAPAITG